MLHRIKKRLGQFFRLFQRSPTKPFISGSLTLDVETIEKQGDRFSDMEIIASQFESPQESHQIRMELTWHELQVVEH